MIYSRKSTQIYDAWLHWEITLKCNLQCDYCFFTEPSRYEKKDIKYYYKIFKNWLVSQQHKYFQTQSIIKPINISQLLKTLNQEKKTFRISFTGGEPFLVPNIIDACIALSRRHYLSFNTNLTSSLIEIFSKKIMPNRVLFIVASLHLKELERRNLEKKYISNFLKLKKQGFKIFAEEVGYPSLAKEVGYYRNKYKKNGITIGFDPFIGTYQGKRYPESYTKEQIRIFRIKEKDLDIFTKWQNKHCLAGSKAAVVCPDGKIYNCFQMHESRGNIYRGIKMLKKSIVCPFEYCGCPLNYYDPYLYQKQLKNY